ncbi:hypothetical protein FKW77_008596 [Venturia effusa]|uniref:Uncharacterized protein n=1 Tax=Venturia effusa TaxID=50376 RepID=A0A517LG71_9PEZI|nr:hypothetical protein FKW77_008596 [Venturia effusa]
MLTYMMGLRKSVHWVLGALTYYFVWPIYYLYQIASAAWLVYRISHTAARKDRGFNSKGVHRPYHDHLQTHVRDLERQTSRECKHEPIEQNNEIRHPITVVTVDWKSEKQEVYAKHAERLSVLVQQYSDASREERYSKRTSRADMLDYTLTQKSGPPNLSKKFPTPGDGGSGGPG